MHLLSVINTMLPATPSESYQPRNDCDLGFGFPPLPTPRKRLRRCVPTCTASKKVLILGGTGRVGSEAAKALQTLPEVQITLASRRSPDYLTPGVGFTSVDITDAKTLLPAIESHDIVLHTAGPFQHSATPKLILDHCIRAGKPYIDISDDTEHSTATKSLHAAAITARTPALISTGIYPGLSNLLAANAVTRLKDLSAPIDTLDMYYHTAGSGGIGATVLAATMLLLSETAADYTPSGPVYHPAASGVTPIDFGHGIGSVDTYRLNLPEVYSLHKYLVPSASVSARFSTAPSIWNVLLQGMARLPKELLGNRGAMQALAAFSMPIVRAVDKISGARTAIVVKAGGEGRDVMIRFSCERLDRYVGLSTAAFVKAVLEERVEPGVWFPEELPESVRKRVVDDAVGNGTLEIFENEKLLSV